ncbi:hypothetical protein GGS21DRAFT_488619 [Xylaria nigripes]|nr:hypothetical protein GGS21DRAFT_488619 [Xylaria nigripes]
MTATSSSSSSPMLQALIGDEFTVFSECEAAVHAAAKADSIPLVIYSKRPAGPNFKRVIWRCRTAYRPAHLDTDDPKRRKSSTKSTGCRFRIASRLRNNGIWIVESVNSVGCQQHNHPTLPLAAYSRYRQHAARSFCSDIIEMAESGITPTDITAKLRSNGDPEAQNITRKDIANIIAKHRRQQFTGL